MNGSTISSIDLNLSTWKHTFLEAKHTCLVTEPLGIIIEHKRFVRYTTTLTMAGLF